MNSKGEEAAQKLIQFAIENGESELLRYIRDEASKALSENRALVRHAVELSDETRKKLISSIKERFPEAIEIDFELDESLVGGIEVYFRDYRYDGSLKSKFEKAKAQLVG